MSALADRVMRELRMGWRFQAVDKVVRWVPSRPGFRIGQRVIVDGKYPGVIKRLGLTAAAVSPTPLVWQRRQLGGSWWKTHWAKFPRWPRFRTWWKSAGPLLRVPYVEMVPIAEFNPLSAQAQHADWD